MREWRRYQTLRENGGRILKVFQEELEIWEKYSENKIVNALPPHLDIELTNRCNLFCSKCPYHGKDKVFEQEPCDMDFELYKKIIDEASTKNVRSVKLSFSGEPLLYPRIMEAIIYAKKRGLQVNINSNGVFLNTATSQALIKSQLDVIILSDYDLDSQLKGASILHAQKEVLRKENPYIVMKGNNVMKWEGIADEIIPLVFHDYSKLQEDHERYDFSCGMPWQRMLIRANGDVLSCACGIGMIDLERSTLGNITRSNLEDLWNSQKMQFLRVCHENNESHLVNMCRKCPLRRKYIDKE